MTKPIILVKICCMSFKELKLNSCKVTSWPQLISEFLIARLLTMLLLSDLALFYDPDVFVYHITASCKPILLLCGSIYFEA